MERQELGLYAEYKDDPEKDFGTIELLAQLEAQGTTVDRNAQVTAALPTQKTATKEVAIELEKSASKAVSPENPIGETVVRYIEYGGTAATNWLLALIAFLLFFIICLK